MTIFLHVGVGKTGTTTLQVFLDTHREVLARRGLVVAAAPRSRNHRALAVHALEDGVIDNARRTLGLTTPEAIAAFRAELAERMRQEAAALPAGARIVFTSEQLSRLTQPAEFARLKDLLALYGPHDIKVIAYLRRQDQYYASAYSQSVKGGAEAEMRPKKKLLTQSVYNYEIFLTRWAEAFGESSLMVRVFERGQMAEGDIIADFFATIGFDGHADLDRPPRQNQSLDVTTLDFLRRLNPQIPRYLDGAANRRRPQLIAALEALSTGPRPRLDPAEAQAFLRGFEASNAAVARRFLGRADGRLFLDPPEEGEAPRSELDLDRAMALTAELLNRLLRA